MNAGRIIRNLRREHDMTQEELGKMLTPRVNRQAINKWETGRVENIKRSHIEQMATIFGVKPSVFFDYNQEEEESLSNEEKILLFLYREMDIQQKKDLFWYATALRTKRPLQQEQPQKQEKDQKGKKHPDGYEPLDPYLEKVAKDLGIIRDRE